MFKVGQLVWCKKKGYYGVTDYHVKCKVVRVSNKSKSISVQVLEGFCKGNVDRLCAAGVDRRQHDPGGSVQG